MKFQLNVVLSFIENRDENCKMSMIFLENFVNKSPRFVTKFAESLRSERCIVFRPDDVPKSAFRGFQIGFQRCKGN